MNIQCINCGLMGHYIQKCRYPIISYGIILYDLKTKKYLMICRSKSFGYIEFLIGNYTINNPIQMQYLIDEMSVEEKDKLKTLTFPQLWNDIWSKKIVDEKSKKKFSNIENLHEMIDSSATQWETPEWEFPKGRKKIQEKMMDCAIREFTEETGYTSNDIQIIENVIPFEEVFIGSNVKVYKHKYYLAVLKGSQTPPNSIQYSEISTYKWLSYEDCLMHIRDYNDERKTMLSKVNHLVTKYNIII